MVVNVDPIWKMKTAFASPCPSSVTLPADSMTVLGCGVDRAECKSGRRREGCSMARDIVGHYSGHGDSARRGQRECGRVDRRGIHRFAEGCGDDRTRTRAAVSGGRGCGHYCGRGSRIASASDDEDDENLQQRCEPDLITVVSVSLSLHDRHPSGCNLCHRIILSAAGNPHKTSFGPHTLVGIVDCVTDTL